MPKQPFPAAPSSLNSHYFTVHPLAKEPAGEVDCDGGASGTHRIEARAAALSLAFWVGTDVFSKRGLDAGTRLLIECARLKPGSRICDIGCGWGAVGCFASALDPTARVSLCDINRLAVALARRNIRDLGLSNATAWCGDGLQAVKSESFDVALCNPPVRAGNATMARLFADAHRCTRSGGSLWIVLRTAQGAKSWQGRLAALYGDCRTANIEQGYRIFECVKTAT